MAQPGIVFLMYHELQLPGRPLCHSDPGYVRYILHQETFASQMKWLSRNGWRCLSVGEALDSPRGNSVVVTFDDGCETDLIGAAPTLRQYGFNATFYVTVGRVGQSGYLSTGQLRQLRDFGFEIGCHTMSHAYLGDLEYPDLSREIVDSKKRLEDMIGGNVQHFSCPGGRYDGRTSNLVRESGYRSMATSRPQANFPSTNSYFLGRVAILRTIKEPAFRRICNGEILWRMRLGESFRGTAKRAFGNRLYDRLRAALLERR
jgi:peptidoglycan/xylan/chitin deacetylase (PgdA/CDA1 family)